MLVVNGLSVAQLLLMAVLVYVSRGQRLLAAAIQALILWFAGWAGLMAGMSMSGDWL
jgi:hypothetical protein